MAATVLKETKSLSAIEGMPAAPAAAVVPVAEVEAVSTVKCYSCGLTEECTPPYIARVRERYQGRWICGLCAEAVKEETFRSQRAITTDEALKRHIMFCQQFRSSSPPNKPTEELIVAVKQLFFRSLDSPSKDRLNCRPLGRSQSCFAAMPGTTQTESHSEGKNVEGREVITSE